MSRLSYKNWFLTILIWNKLHAFCFPLFAGFASYRFCLNGISSDNTVAWKSFLKGIWQTITSKPDSGHWWNTENSPSLPYLRCFISSRSAAKISASFVYSVLFLTKTPKSNRKMSADRITNSVATNTAAKIASPYFWFMSLFTKATVQETLVGTQRKSISIPIRVIILTKLQVLCRTCNPLWGENLISETYVNS